MQAERDAEKDLAMCEAATLGPWEWEELNRFIMGGDTVVASVVGGDEVTGPYVYLADNDARFITEAREALPYWIQRAVAAEAEAQRFRAALEKIDIHIRSTSDAVPHIIETLKRALPEYKDWWDIGE